MNKISTRDETDERCEAVDSSPYIEMVCWTMILLFPLLYWVNGPAVSSDQLVVRTALMVVAVSGAIGCRLAKWWKKRKAERSQSGKVEELQSGEVQGSRSGRVEA
jgi:hypothetical protein